MATGTDLFGDAPLPAAQSFSATLLPEQETQAPTPQDASGTQQQNASQWPWPKVPRAWAQGASGANVQ
jgi:hypothetical protein